MRGARRTRQITSRQPAGRPAVLACVAALVAALVAGCGGQLPDSGAAGPGRKLGGLSNEPLQVSAQGPVADVEPDELVEGFLVAGAGFEDDHAVARRYLTGPVQHTWRPGQRTVVYTQSSDPPTATVSGGGARRTVVVRVGVWGEIDEEGHLTLSPSGATAKATFGLTRVSGQWRIDQLDDSFGLWMPGYEFERAYTPVRLSFIARGTRIVVPDLRWFAGGRAALATQVAQSLLAGPSPELAPAVTTGAPAGTTLGVDAVPTTGGVAQVDLSPNALSATPEERQELWAQLAITLRQLPNVTDVSLTAGGSAYPVPGVAASAAGGTDLGYSEDVRVSGPVLVLSHGQLRQVDPGTGALAEASGRFPRSLDVAGLRSFTAGPQAGLLAGVDASGTALVTVPTSAPRQVVVRGGDLGRPVLDRSGWVWVADRARAGEVLVAPVTSSASAVSGSRESVTTLRPSWLAGRRVEALDVSRDGARLAVVSSAPDGTRRLDVAGVVREDTGRPTQLAPARAVGQPLPSIRDVSWADRTDLVVLSGAAGAVQPYQVQVGGVVTALPTVSGPVGIWAGDGLRAVYVTTASGQVMERSGSGWRQLGAGTSVSIPQ